MFQKNFFSFSPEDGQIIKDGEMTAGCVHPCCAKIFSPSSDRTLLQTVLAQFAVL